MKRGLIVLVATSLLTSACASVWQGQPTEPGVPWSQVRPASVPVKQLRAPLGANTDTKLEVVVHLERKEDVTKFRPYGAVEGAATAAGSTGAMVALGGLAVLFGGPAAASAAVVGTGLMVLLSPYFIVEGYRHATQRDAVVKALIERPLPPRLQAALIRRLGRAHAVPAEPDTMPPPDTTRIAVSIDVYGLTLVPPQHEEMLCFSLTGSVSVTASSETEFADAIYWEPHRRSEDLPPPQCADLPTFAAHHGRLVRDALEETAEVLAAAVVKRLRGTQ
jgi:hypothetical protein